MNVCFSPWRGIARCWLLLLLALVVAEARAGITFTLEFQRDRLPAQYGGLNLYFGYPSLSADSNSVPLTIHRVFGPDTNHQATVGTNFGSGGSALHFTLADLLAGINGTWTLILNEGHPSAQTNHFTLTLAGMTSNSFPAATILLPANGATGLPPATPFHWTGPAGWTELNVNVHSEDYLFYESANLPPASTNWPAAPPVLVGTNVFVVNYKSNAAPFATVSTPTNVIGGASLTGWSNDLKIVTITESWFTVVTPLDPPAELRAHHSFDNPFFAGQDTSGLNNHITSGSWCDIGPPVHSTNAGVFGGAMIYHGSNWNSLSTNLVPVFASNFSVSLWVKTTSIFGSDTDPAFAGAGLLSASSYLPPYTETIPLALTGSKLAFTTSDLDFNYDTLHSTSDINTGVYTHIVVTRAQATGRMKLYVNGVLEDSAINNIARYTNFTGLTLGHKGNCFNGAASTIDEVQIYRGVLSSNQVAYLYANPTNTAPLESTLGEAVDAPQFTWTTGSDAAWTAQSMVAFDGLDAAQSGAISNYQSTYLETTVQGPGIVEFTWKVAADNFDYLEFYVDGNYRSYIDTYSDWTTESYTVPGGTRTLRWEYWADNSAVGNTNRGWLDQVTFTQLPPVQVTSLTNTGAGFQFQFLSNDGFDHYVEYRDDLATGTWLPYTNLFGNGGLLTVVQPATNIQKRFFRVRTE
jgi:hypothetical protein